MRPALLLLAAEAALAANSVRSHSTANGKTTFQLSGGTLEVEYISSSALRVQRCKTGAPCPSRPGVKNPPAVKVRAAGKGFELQSEYLTATVSRLDSTVHVRNRHGQNLFQETAGLGLLEWQLAPNEQIWGLGPRPSPKLDLRGTSERTVRPLVISSVGYGVYLGLPGQYDFAVSDRVRVSGGMVRDRVEYFVYYGPSPLEVMAEHAAIAGLPQGVDHADLEPRIAAPRYATFLEASGVRDALALLAHGSMSGVTMPALALTPEVRRIAPWVPFLALGAGEELDPNTAAERRRYEPYMTTYLWEARDSGRPMVRALGFQYPEEPGAFENLDQFMLGDELMVAAGPRAYLPRGIWTSLNGNKAHRGRQVIELGGEGATAFARNGSIIPLRVGGVTQLHYFPRLGAEFFLAEPAAKGYTKVHAGPAVEYLRLEVEPVVGRDFEWVVHNVSPADEVRPTGVTLPEGAVRYDEALGNLHVRIRAEAGSDAILNVALRKPL